MNPLRVADKDNFNFKIEATKSTVDANPAAPMPAECSSSDATKNDCTISYIFMGNPQTLVNITCRVYGSS